MIHLPILSAKIPQAVITAFTYLLPVVKFDILDPLTGSWINFDLYDQIGIDTELTATAEKE